MELSTDLIETQHKRRQSFGSWGASFALHGGLMLLLAWLTIVQPAILLEESITASLGKDVDPDEIRLSEGLSSFHAVSQGGSSNPETAASRVVSQVTRISVKARDPKMELQTARDEAESSSPHLGDYVGVQLGRVGGGNGHGDGLGAGEGSGMFGPPGDASSFVFVLDRSGSMKAPHRESVGMSRFQRLQLELVKFISQLQPTQQFYVIFFNSEATPMPSETLVPATDFNKARYLEWIARLRAEGQTDPRYSLKLAMKLHPDQIFFLSDGDVMDRHRKQLLRLEPGDWQLNTFTFGTGVGPFMKSFAEKHGGKYTLIR